MQLSQQQPIFPLYIHPFIPNIQPIEDIKSTKKDKKNHKKKKDHKIAKTKTKPKTDKKPIKIKKTKKPKKSKVPPIESSQSIPYTEGLHLSGILNYLTTKTCGNICDNETISIVGSSTQDGSQDARYLCDFSDLSDSSMWSPDNEINANILFDFKQRKIKLTHYSFHTPIDDTSDYPRYWKVECSNDLASWKLVDTQNDVHSMNRNDACVTFKCQNVANEFYRYIRITSTGPCWTNNQRYYFDLAADELSIILLKIQNDETKEINITNETKELRPCIFAGYQITFVKLPESIITIPESAFASCIALTIFKCSQNLKHIGPSAFFQCIELVEFEIPPSVEIIDDSAFRLCKKLNTKLPPNLKRIGNFAFYDCFSLEEANIPESCESIGTSSFFNCTSLKVLELSPSLKSIPGTCFSQCSSLKEVTITNSVESIGDKAFWKCSSLEHVEIPSSVKTMGKESFAYCSLIKIFEIPYSLEYFGEYCFYPSFFKRVKK